MMYKRQKLGKLRREFLYTIYNNPSHRTLNFFMSIRLKLVWSDPKDCLLLISRTSTLCCSVPQTFEIAPFNLPAYTRLEFHAKLFFS